MLLLRLRSLTLENIGKQAPLKVKLMCILFIKMLNMPLKEKLPRPT